MESRKFCVNVIIIDLIIRCFWFDLFDAKGL